MKKSNPKIKSLHRNAIVHIVTGSIAAYKAGDLVSELRECGARVICVLTESAKQFVTPLVLRALSGERVYHDFFSADTPYDVIHTSLAEEADMILVSPASADFIARLAAGMAGDLASCIVLAARRPVLVVPAMNDQMFHHALTQQNIRKLKDAGYHVMDPIEGPLVCGKEAIGHIPETASIVQRVKTLLALKNA